MTICLKAVVTQKVEVIILFKILIQVFSNSQFRLQVRFRFELRILLELPKYVIRPSTLILGEMAMLQKNILQRQENLDKTVENAEKIKEDSRIFSQSTGKLVEKVRFYYSILVLLIINFSIKRRNGFTSNYFTILFIINKIHSDI